MSEKRPARKTAGAPHAAKQVKPDNRSNPDRLGSTPALRCLGGASPSHLVLEDWRKLEGLPARALDSLYDLVKPSLGPKGASPSELESRAQAFCKLYDIAQGDLSAALRSWVFLLTRASQLALPLDAFRQDIAALSTVNAAVVDVIVSRYEEARSLIRQEMIQGALFDHGKVLVGIDWRLDMILASDRGAELGMPVALLTLHCRNGREDKSREERVTLYAIPEMVRQLRSVLDRLDRQMAPSGQHVTRDQPPAPSAGATRSQVGPGRRRSPSRPDPLASEPADQA